MTSVDFISTKSRVGSWMMTLACAHSLDEDCSIRAKHTDISLNPRLMYVYVLMNIVRYTIYCLFVGVDTQP